MKSFNNILQVFVEKFNVENFVDEAGVDWYKCIFIVTFN